jgi:uncharacterized protein YqjF (DUF2071 family)
MHPREHARLARFGRVTRGNPSSVVETTDWISPDPPQPVERPMLRQAWRTCSFLHWPYAPDVLRRHVPSRFELDVADGSAWVSLISFSIPTMRPLGLPPVPGFDRAAESHLRTYVVDPQGRRGIWMLSLDIDPVQAAMAGRLFLLPYWWATIEVERASDLARYRVDRHAPGVGRVELEMDIGDVIPSAALGDLDHFLTARWILYAGAAGASVAMFTEHPPWRMRETSIRSIRQSVSKHLGLPEPGRPPVLHFSDGVDARLSRPFPVAAPPQGRV